MDINKDLQLINTFTGGMNTDVSDALLLPNLYREAYNLRIVTDTDSNTGELRLIEGGVSLYIEQNRTLLAFTYCRDLGIIVSKSDNDWRVSTFRNGDEKLETVLTCKESIGNAISVETVYESEKNIKLYIADGEHQTLVINCANTYGEVSLLLLINIDNFILPQITKIEVIPGNLKPALVQYSYRYYNKYGTSTRISPASLLLRVELKTNDVVTGVEYDNPSDTGFRIYIPTNSQYDSIIIYRITYQQAGQLPTIEIIFDGNTNNLLISEDRSSLVFDDVNYNRVVATTTIEQYNAVGGISIIPKTICSKDNMLFVANIKQTDSLEEYKEFDNWNSSTDIKQNLDLSKPYDIDEWRINKTGVADTKHDIHNWFGNDYSGEYYGTSGENCKIELQLISETLCKINDGTKYAPDYDYDEQSLYISPSLKGGEIYRYGIVLYHSNGMPHPAKWIGDIRIPEITERSSLYSWLNDPFTINSQNLLAYAAHTKITVRNLPKGCIAYEIVRAPRTAIDSSSITQGVVSAYAKQLADEDSNLIFPTGYVALNQIEFVKGEDSIDNRDYSDYTYSQCIHSETKIDNNLLFFSPEISYFQNDFISKYKYDDSVVLNILYEVSPYSSDLNTVHDNVDIEAQYGFDPTKETPHIEEPWPHAANVLNQAIFLDVFRLTGNTISPLFYRRRVELWQTEDHENRLFALRLKVRNPLSWIQLRKETLTAQSETYDFYYYAKMNNTPYPQLHNCSDSIDYEETDYLFNRKAVSYVRLYNHEYINENVPNRNVNITNIVVPTIANYDDFANASGQLLYKDNTTAIGSVSYNCWVAHMLGGYIKRDGGSPLSDDSWETVTISDAIIQSDLTSSKPDGLADARKNYSYAPLGIGGTCAVLEGLFLNNILIHDAYKYNYEDDKIRSYVCDIKRKTVVPYGGTLKPAIINTTYCSTGYFVQVGPLDREYETILDSDGDIYLGNFEFISSHQLASILNNHVNIAVVYSVPIESTIDFSHTHGAYFSKYVQRRPNIVYHSLIQEKPTSFLNYYNQTEPMYLYNSAYSSESTVKLFFSLEYLDKKIDCSNRIFYSNPKTVNEYIDSWTQFQPANFLDVDAKYGEVTHLDTFNGNLFFWQEDAFGLLPVHERVQIQDDNNLSIILGVGGVLDRYDYLSTLKGMKANLHADAKSHSGLYWWDEERNELQQYRIGSAPVSLSKTKNIQNYINSNKLYVSKPAMFFDPKYNEVLANVTRSDKTVTFSETIDAYSSIYDIGFVGGITIDRTSYLAANYNNSFCITKWNTSDDHTSVYPALDVYGELKPSLKYVVNSQPMFVKTFDNLLFSGKFYGGSDVVRQTYKTEPYYVAGEHDNTPLLPLLFEYSTPLNQHSTTDGSLLTNREYDFRLAIPREGNKPEYGNRMRGKTMQCKLSSDSNSLDFSLQYIITKFRMSWS